MASYLKSTSETLFFPDGTVHHHVPLHLISCKPLRDVGVELAGVSDAPAGYRVARHGQLFYELLYVTAGSGWAHSQGGDFAVGPADILLLPPGVPYEYGAGPEGWSLLWFHIRGMHHLSKATAIVPVTRPAAMKQETVAAVNGILLETLRTDGQAPRLMRLFAEQVALYLSREVSFSESPHDRRMRALLEDLMRLLQSTMQRNWRVRDMADQLHLSVPQFHRVCLRYAGRTPLNILRDLRMQRAEEMLLHYDYPLSAIAEIVGYEGPYAFSNAFKRHKGLSPSEFRDRGRKSTR